MTFSEAKLIAMNHPGFKIVRHPDDGGFVVVDTYGNSVDASGRPINFANKSTPVLSQLRNDKSVPDETRSRIEAKRQSSNRFESDIAQAISNLDRNKKKARQLVKDKKVVVTGPHASPDYKRYIDEGIAGTRQDNKRARSQISRDILGRGRGN